jgi:hypothetical protein
MTASLQATALLANDPLFQSRVNAAMVTAAINVASEAIGSMTLGVYNARHDLAVAILQGAKLGGGFGGAPGPNPWLSQFSWTTAANVSISGDVGMPVQIAASTDTDPSVITTITAHGLSTGQWVEISDHQLNTVINGLWEVTVTDSTDFSVPAIGTAAGGATGQVVLQPPDSDIQFAVNSVFGSMAGVGTVV